MGYPYPPSSHWIHVFTYKSFRLEQNHFTGDEVGHTFWTLVLAIMELSDQELSIALKEFETTMVDVSELDRTVICAAVEFGVCDENKMLDGERAFIRNT